MVTPYGHTEMHVIPEDHVEKVEESAPWPDFERLVK